MFVLLHNLGIRGAWTVQERLLLPLALRTCHRHQKRCREYLQSLAIGYRLQARLQTKHVGINVTTA